MISTLSDGWAYTATQQLARCAGACRGSAGSPEAASDHGCEPGATWQLHLAFWHVMCASLIVPLHCVMDAVDPHRLWGRTCRV